MPPLWRRWAGAYGLWCNRRLDSDNLDWLTRYINTIEKDQRILAFLEPGLPVVEDQKGPLEALALKGANVMG